MPRPPEAAHPRGVHYPAGVLGAAILVVQQVLSAAGVEEIVANAA